MFFYCICICVCICIRICTSCFNMAAMFLLYLYMNLYLYLYLYQIITDPKSILMDEPVYAKIIFEKRAVIWEEQIEIVRRFPFHVMYLSFMPLDIRWSQSSSSVFYPSCYQFNQFNVNLKTAYLTNVPYGWKFKHSNQMAPSILIKLCNQRA